MKSPGDRIGRFRVERLLGQGGAAEVYQVRHELLETVYALKLLPVARRGMAKRLIQEGRIQAHLRHPNVVAVTDVIEEKGQIGLVMEFIEGPSLEELIRSDGAMEFPEAMDLFVQVLSGVAAAHQAGVLHRDLKPANVLLTTEGERVVAKVADFGIARMSMDGESESTASRPRKPIGTPGYMAPEQFNDPEATDARSDIFALGAILYEMLTGRRAFGASASAKEVFEAVMRGRFAPLSQLAPRTPAGVEVAVHRALSVRPEDRFPSCLDLAEALSIRAEIVPLRVMPPLDELAPLDGPAREGAPAEPPAFDTANDFLEDREELPIITKRSDAVITWTPEEGDDEFGLPNAGALPVAAAKAPPRQRQAENWTPPPTPARPVSHASPMDEPALAPDADQPSTPGIPPKTVSDHGVEPLFRQAPAAPDSAAKQHPPRPAPEPLFRPAGRHIEPRPASSEHRAEPRPAKPAVKAMPAHPDPQPDAPEPESSEPKEPSALLRLAPMVLAPVALIVALVGAASVLGSSSVRSAQTAALKEQADLELAFSGQPQLVADALRLATADGTAAPSLSPDFFERRLAASQSAPDFGAKLDASRELREFLSLQVPTLYKGEDPTLLALRHDLETRVRTLGEEQDTYEEALSAWRDAASTPIGSLSVMVGMAEAPAEP